MLLNLTENDFFFFLREAFCGLEYPENAFAAGALLRTPLGELTTLPILPSRLGRGHPPQTAPNSAPSVPRLSGLPLVDIISGYVTDKVCYKVSLCENFQRQSYSTAIPLSNGPYRYWSEIEFNLKVTHWSVRRAVSLP